MNRREFIINTMLLALSSNSLSNIMKAKNIELNKELMLAGNIKFDDNLKNYQKIANYLDLSGGLETSGLKDISKIDIFLNNLNKLKNDT